MVGLLSVPVMLAPLPAAPPVIPPVTTGVPQLYVVPAGTILPPPFAGVNVKAVPPQVAGVCAVTNGVGFTITVTVVEVKHEPAVAVIVNVVVCWELVLFVNVPFIVAPVPLAPMPVRFTVLSLVQLKVVPETLLGLVITIFEIAVPEQIV